MMDIVTIIITYTFDKYVVNARATALTGPCNCINTTYKLLF